MIQNNNLKKVIVMGKGPLAINISNWFLNDQSHELVYIVPVIPEPTWTDSIRSWAIKNEIPFIKSGHYNDLPNINSIDLVFSVFYDKIIEETFIKKCNNILNMHNGPLPKYRGVSPINWALKNNEREHGVTIHEITKGIDDGPIYAQLKYSIYPEFDEVIDVYKRALEYGWVLFQQTMPILYEIVPKPQNESKSSYYSRKKDYLLEDRKDITKKESLSNRDNL